MAETTPEGKFWVHPKFTVLPVTRPGPFVELSDGSLLTVEDNATRISSDNGKTWSAPRAICEGIESGVPSRSHALLKTRDGVIVLVYMDSSTYKWEWEDEKGFASADTRLDVWSIRSLDDGKTWTDRRKILDGYCGALIDSIQTSTGEIVVPVQDLSPDRTRHVQYTYVSTDDGKSWTRSNMIDLGGHGHHDGAFEATLAELGDGRLLMLLRTSLDEFWRAYSADKGRSWRVLEPSGIDASNSPGHLVRLASGRLVLVWNRLYREGETSTRRTDYWPGLCERPCSLQREQLSVAFSEDDGKTWTEPVVFIDHGGHVCYPQVHERRPGELWITTGRWQQGPVVVGLKEADFVGK